MQKNRTTDAVIIITDNYEACENSKIQTGCHCIVIT